MEKREIASSKPPAQTNQKRKQVQKDIWFSQDASTRLHYQIASVGSFLSLTPVGNHFEIVETLEEIRCWMQDKLLPASEESDPMQQTRYIEAKEGSYCHSSQEFLANDVTLSLFRIEGHTLPSGHIDENEAFLRGIARDISFHFNGKTPQFQAAEFQATVVRE